MINVKLLPTNPHIIQETGDENIETYQVEAAILISHQVLITNLQGNVWQLEGELTIRSWELKVNSLFWLC